jgi:hypothetical protein
VLPNLPGREAEVAAGGRCPGWSSLVFDVIMPDVAKEIGFDAGGVASEGDPMLVKVVIRAGVVGGCCPICWHQRGEGCEGKVDKQDPPRPGRGFHLFCCLLTTRQYLLYLYCSP